MKLRRFLVSGPILMLALVLLAACGRQGQAPEAASASSTSDSTAPDATPRTAAWSWHPLGGLAVVEGEVAQPTELVLEGRSIREHRFAEPGPVRWEFFRPPEGETAVLRTAEGRELARFDFSLAALRKPAPTAPRLAQKPASPPAVVRPPTSQPPAPPPPAPQAQAPQAPAPRARAEAHLRTLPPSPIPSRGSRALPEVSREVSRDPGESSRRTTAPLSVLPESGTPHPLASTAPIPAASLSQAWPGMGEALNLTRGPGGRKRILLSFDGGSSAEVATEVLDLLKARGIRTTLFLTGTFIQRYPALVRRMAAEGHELGNHTMNHPHFAPGMKRDAKWTRERMQRELLDADAALVRLVGRPMDPYWRAPYGEHTAEIRRWAEELGYRHVGWSEGADTLDWATPKDRRLYRSGEAIVQRLQQRLGKNGDGLIVLMHLGSGRSSGDRPTDGLGAFLDRARGEGWTFVTAGTFLHDLGKPAWDPHQRLALLGGASAQGR